MIYDFEAIKRNIYEISKKIDGRARLLAATKTVPAEVINYALGCGISLIGENRTNELVDKFGSIDKEKTEIHFIGALQTNKVKFLPGRVTMIHSLDSHRLASEIDRRAEKAGVVMDCLVEINIEAESTKSGISIDEAEEFALSLLCYKHIRLRGLMTIPPFCTAPGGNNRSFEKISKKFVDISVKKVDNGSEGVVALADLGFDTLSMGMSDDYLDAVDCGSNLVRVGSAIFGHREYAADLS